MKKIFVLLMIFTISLFANFFVLDNGKIVEIVNEPSKNVEIIGSNGKILKKHTTLASVKRQLQKSKRYYKKKKRVTKKKKVYKKRVTKKRVIKKKVAKKKVIKKYKKRKKE